MAASTKITMGNDEFILYIRKTNPNCTITNDKLGKTIWEWLQWHDKSAVIIAQSKPCLWEHSGPSVQASNLPKTATQFEFERALLPALYSRLDAFCSVPVPVGAE